MSRYRDVALFLALGVLWGGSFPAIKAGLDGFTPLFFASLRFDLSGVLLVGYAALALDHWYPRGRAEWLSVLAGGALFVAVGNGFVFLGEQFTTSGVAAVLMSLIPLATAALGWVLLPRSSPSPVALVGVVLGLAGVVVVANPDPQNLLAPNVVGIGLLVCSTVGSALGTVLVERIDATFPDATMTGWSMVVGAVALHVTALAVGEPLVPARVPGLVPLGALVYLGVASSAVAYLIFFGLLARVGAFEVNLVSYLVPVVATVVGWLLLGERLTAFAGVGFLLIFAGFVALKRRQFAAELRRLGVTE